MTLFVFEFGLLIVRYIKHCWEEGRYQSLLNNQDSIFTLVPKCQHIPRAILDDSERLFVTRSRIMNVQTFWQIDQTYIASLQILIFKIFRAGHA